MPDFLVITARELSILNIITCFSAEKGYPPTRQDISTQARISMISVARCINSLRSKGAITPASKPRKFRDLQIIPILQSIGGADS